jgi:hypothetical protein
MHGSCTTYTILNVYYSELEPLNEQDCYTTGADGAHYVSAVSKNKQENLSAGKAHYASALKELNPEGPAVSIYQQSRSKKARSTSSLDRPALYPPLLRY